MKWGVCLTSVSASCPLLQIGQKHAVCPSMRCSEAGFTRRCRSMLASRFIIGWKNIFFLYVLKKTDGDAPNFFQSCRPPRPSVPYYWRDLLIGGRYRYLHRRAVLFSFCFTFVIYKFKNVSVRKCLIVQLAKFFMLFIIISTNSLNEIKLSLRPIISTATRQ